MSATFDKCQDVISSHLTLSGVPNTAGVFVSPGHGSQLLSQPQLNSTLLGHGEDFTHFAISSEILMPERNKLRLILCSSSSSVEIKLSF